MKAAEFHLLKMVRSCSNQRKTRRTLKAKTMCLTTRTQLTRRAHTMQDLAQYLHHLTQTTMGKTSTRRMHSSWTRIDCNLLVQPFNTTNLIKIRSLGEGQSASRHSLRQCSQNRVSNRQWLANLTLSGWSHSMRIASTLHETSRWPPYHWQSISLPIKVQMPWGIQKRSTASSRVSIRPTSRSRVRPSADE